jgi:hypothetical protein
LGVDELPVMLHEHLAVEIPRGIRAAGGSTATKGSPLNNLHDSLGIRAGQHRRNRSI